MTYIFYKDVIAEIAVHLQYQSVVHLLGRDYSDETILDYVGEHNPFLIDLKDKEGNTKASETSNKKVTIGMLKDMGMFN